MICGIYKIVNTVNGKCYIGQARDIEKRWREHKSSSKTVDSHLYSAIRKYGLDNFLFEVIVECDEHMLDEFEIGIIKLYETTDSSNGYNKQSGGANGRHSDETKKKMSESRKGKTRSNLSKQKTSETLKKQYQYQGIVYNGMKELADFLGITYFALSSRIRRKQIYVTIIPKND